MSETILRSDEAPGTDRVTTGFHFRTPPEAVWKSLMFYEDVPRQPWPLLRMFLPRPIRSEGDKRLVGSIVRCVYDRGYLIKRITVVEPARLLRFEVVEQSLGIEGSVKACWGSYQLSDVGGGTDVVLTTHYLGRLRPRFLWRPIERYLCLRLHLHILFGMRAALAAEPPLLGTVTPAAEDLPDTVAAATR
jgi:hypothetical protein